MSDQASTKKMILIVDDEPDVCVYLNRLFQENGYATTSAGDGNEALRAIEKERPDLITLDLAMPDKSGVKFYREIKASPGLANIPVVFVTGVTGPGGNPSDTERFYKTRSQVPPPDGFIAKPIDPEEILGLVSKLTGQQQ
jgi:CheY-like chemotaxis protein